MTGETAAADLVTQGLCSGGCLVATSSPKVCRCVCRGETHGTLADSVVTPRPFEGWQKPRSGCSDLGESKPDREVYDAWMRTLRGADITHAEFSVLANLSTYADSGMIARPGFARLIDAACVNEKTARKALRVLEDKGWIELVERGGGGRRDVNGYLLTTPIGKGQS